MCFDDYLAFLTRYFLNIMVCFEILIFLLIPTVSVILFNESISSSRKKGMEKCECVTLFLDWPKEMKNDRPMLCEK